MTGNKGDRVNTLDEYMKKEKNNYRLLDNEYLSKYKDEGYCICPEIIKQEQIDEFFNEYKKLLIEVAKELSIDHPKLENNSDIDNLTCMIYDISPNAGGFIYDTMNRHQIFYKMFENKLLKSILSELLMNKNGNCSLAVTNHQFFIHRPNITKEDLGWQQDSSYFREYSTENHSAVVWFTLRDCSSKNGSLIIMP